MITPSLPPSWYADGAGYGDPTTNVQACSATVGNFDCESPHPMVGWVAEMPSGSHHASGTATIVDDCTVEVTPFNFDGGGDNVRFYGGRDGDYADGLANSGDIFGAAYSNEAVTLTLPEDKTFDDMDGISVWCVAFDVSFTDAIFEAP